MKLWQIAARPSSGGGYGTYLHRQRPRFRAQRVTHAVPHRPPVLGGTRMGGHRPRNARNHEHPGRRDMRGDSRPAGPVLPATPVTRPATYDELNDLCRGIQKSFVHLETRDAYGTDVESPHLAKWRRGETDDFAWLDWWLEMLRGH